MYLESHTCEARFLTRSGELGKLHVPRFLLKTRR